ncbi:FtsX-like permease family protein [Vibrio sp. OCN044]|uniref:FtsX-like permease family protein n=1 Tax=Vibrio tetraodonis subsp. pristinus TaxID=2695891 RepID=A0A6L8M0M4_9VIBR|nr:ABC transporter permease [Vibrio tetraodonis]MYM60600.1 FtsX-like permease family protein [Vibrio tetraodonis subsp. pristinus]
MKTLLLQTWVTIMAHRTKSILAVVAISWGMISVVTLMALGEGFYRKQSQSFAFMINDTQIIFPSRTSKPWQGMPTRREINVSHDNVDQLKHADFVADASAVYAKWDANVSSMMGQQLATGVGGVDSAYFPLMQRKLRLGSRNISPSDIKNHTRVAIIGDQLAQMGGLSVGDDVKVNGIPFRVIGILDDESSGISFGDSRRVFIPQTTYRDLWNDKIWMILAKSAYDAETTYFRKNIIAFYAQLFHFDPMDRDALSFLDMSDRSDVIINILRGIQIFLAASGVMTMAVGALGVANILFLSVTERTREIGVRLAVGATPNIILSQFIFEGLILVAIGTALGLGLSLGLVGVLSVVPLPEWIGEPAVTPQAILVALLVTFCLAFLASYFPARRASRLTPVVALSAKA